MKAENREPLGTCWLTDPSMLPAAQALEGNKHCSHSKGGGGGSQRCHGCCEPDIACGENTGNVGNKILALTASEAGELQFHHIPPDCSNRGSYLR